MSLRLRLPSLVLAACAMAAALPCVASAATTDNADVTNGLSGGSARAANIVLTGVDRTVTAGDGKAVNLANAGGTGQPGSFCLGQTTINWGDGTITNTTAYVPVLGAIVSPNHKFLESHLGPDKAPKTYEVTVTSPIRVRGLNVQCNTAGSNTTPQKTLTVKSLVTVVPPGPELTLARDPNPNLLGWYTTTDPVKVLVGAKDPDGLKPLSCTDSLNGGAPTAVTLGNLASTDTILNQGTANQTTVANTARSGDFSVSGEGKHAISCVAEDTTNLKTTKTTNVNIDLTDPTLTVDPEYTIDANNPTGRTIVVWPNPPVHAADNLSGAAATCSPGALVIGWNDVTCTKVTDGAGHVVTFDPGLPLRVYVRSAAEQLYTLSEYVRTNGGFFFGSTAQALLKAAWGYAANGDNANACKQLIAASGLVSKDVSPKLDKTKYALDALRIGAVLDCQV